MLACSFFVSLVLRVRGLEEGVMFGIGGRNIDLDGGYAAGKQTGLQILSKAGGGGGGHPTL